MKLVSAAQLRILPDLGIDAAGGTRLRKPRGSLRSSMAVRKGGGDASGQLRLAADNHRVAGVGRSLDVVGLFAGIGGIELGLSSSGHRTRLLCEIDDGAAAVLATHFPDVPLARDVTTLRRLPREVDLITAGFPCQDLSQAGATAGLGGRASSLIGEVFRLLEARKRSRRPVPWVLLENVPFMLHLSRGAALEVILTTLEKLGYRWAYRVVDSLAFGLPQRRERVFLLATLDGDPRDVLLSQDAGDPPPSQARPDLAFGFYWTEGIRGLGAAVDAVPTLKGGSTVGIPSPPAVLMPNGDVVTPGIEDLERMQGFQRGWTIPAERVARRGHRWKLVGNAVTVNVAEWIGRQIARPVSYDATWDSPITGHGPWPRAAWNVGGGRHASTASSSPVRRPRARLSTFLEQTRLLSARATAGFLSRLDRSRLNRPEWFEHKLEAHLVRMRRAEESAHEPDAKEGAAQPKRASN